MTARRPAASSYGVHSVAPVEPAMLAWRYGDGTPTGGGGRTFTDYEWVMSMPGHGAAPSIWLPSTLGNYGKLTTELTDRLNVVIAPDAGGGETWGGPAAMSALDNWYTWATTVIGLADTCGILAWSMGGLDGLNWARRNTDKVRDMVLLCPATDLNWAHTGWQTEVEAAYGGWPVAAGSNPVADAADYGWCPITIYHGTADATVPYSQSQAFVAAVNDPNVNLVTITGGGHDLASWIPPRDIAGLLTV